MSQDIKVIGNEIKVVDADGNTFYFDVEELKKPEYGKPVKTDWVVIPQDELGDAEEAWTAAKVAAGQYLVDHSL